MSLSYVSFYSLIFFDFLTLGFLRTPVYANILNEENASLLKIPSSSLVGALGDESLTPCEKELTGFLVERSRIPQKMICSQSWQSHFVLASHASFWNLHTLQLEGVQSKILLSHHQPQQLTITFEDQGDIRIWGMDLVSCLFDRLNRGPEHFALEENSSGLPHSRAEQGAEPSFDPSAFQDQDLEKLLRRNRKGIIYFWSPHSIESVQSISTAEKISQKMGLSLTVLLDPDANPDESASVRAQFKLSEKYLIQNRSQSLYLRGTRLFYPGFLWFKNGKIFQGALLGERSSSALKSYFEKVLK